MIRAILYARYSPRPKKPKAERGGVDCQSCEAQLDYCRRYCAGNGLEAIAEYRDDRKSGKRMDPKHRPGLNEALDHVCRIKGVFVAQALSRWARSTIDACAIAERLAKHKADLISITEHFDTTSAAGRLFYTIMAGVATFERELTSERTSAAMRYYQSNGRRMSSNLPYGWMKDPDKPDWMLPCPEEQGVIREIVRLAGQETSLGRPRKLRQIGRVLDRRGIACRDRNGWHHTTIKAILRRERESNPQAS